MNSFIEKLKERTETEARNATTLLRQSRAAAAFDAVLTLALAYDDMIQADKFSLEHQNISVLNETLSMLKFNGLAVNTYSESKSVLFHNYYCFLDLSPLYKISRLETLHSCITI